MKYQPTITAGLLGWMSLAFTTQASAKVVGGPAEYRDVQPLAGVSYSGALGLSGSLGALVGKRAACTREIRGPFLQAEVGLAGGRVSGGAALAWPGFPTIAAIGAKAFVMRSWSTSSTLPQHHTYVGAGVDVEFFYARVGVAGYQRVSGRLGDQRGVRLTLGAGF